MENYKDIIEKLKDDEKFIEVVQETLNERTSKEILRDAQQWKVLLKETQELRQSYENLIADMKVMKEEVIRATWGNKIRHRSVRLLDLGIWQHIHLQRRIKEQRFSLGFKKENVVLAQSRRSDKITWKNYNGRYQNQIRFGRGKRSEYSILCYCISNI